MSEDRKSPTEQGALVSIDSRKFYAGRINSAWHQALDSVLSVGRLLVGARAALPHGEFGAMVENDLPFGPRTAQRLMAIGRNPRFANPTYASLFPNSWETLYAISRLPEDMFQRLVAEGLIHSGVERQEITALHKQAARTQKTIAHDARIVGGLVEDLDRFAAAGPKAGTIYADPPWLYDNQVTRSATRNVYQGLTVADLCQLPVGDLAADDAHLHLWTTNAFLFECPRLFDAWGFEFKSTFVWVKPQLGIGNYWRNSHEILLTAVRGNATRFADHSLQSWLECKRGTHSTKPERVRDFIERASPGPRIELFARSPAAGWFSWGHEIGDSLLAQGVQKVA